VNTTIAIHEPIHQATPLLSLDQSWLFLDIDGVLNNHHFDEVARSNRIDADKVSLLNSILLGTNSKLVLSSAWRYLDHRGDMTLDGLDWLLRSHGVKAEALIGITHPDTPVEWNEKTGRPSRFLTDERGLQIARFRAFYGHQERYVVLDDLDLGISAAGHPFVQTKSDIGLTPRDVGRAIQCLIRK
jgi:hypothetical protein